MKVRRVANGHTAEGEATVASDTMVNRSRAGMHTSDTIDFEYVVSGEVDLTC